MSMTPSPHRAYGAAERNIVTLRMRKIVLPAHSLPVSAAHSRGTHAVGHRTGQ